jgi:dephospho-CoA kinase
MSLLNKKPLLVALTGGIGSGKTIVSQQFERLGVPCFFADKVAGAYYNDIEFCKQLINRIGFYIETCIIKIDYTNDYYLTVLLAEYYYLIKLNPIMSFSIIDTYFNSIYIYK